MVGVFYEGCEGAVGFVLGFAYVGEFGCFVAGLEEGDEGGGVVFAAGVVACVVCVVVFGGVLEVCVCEEGVVLDAVVDVFGGYELVGFVWECC